MSSEHSQSAASDRSIEVTDEVEDDWQRRQYFKRIYNRHEQADEALDILSSTPSRESRQFAVTKVCGLIRLCRPMITDSPVWDELPMGTIEIAKQRGADIARQQKQLAGLQAVLALEDGYQTVVESKAAGNTSATTRRVQSQMLPIDVIRAAFNHITQELYDRDILSDTEGEADAKDRSGGL